LTSSNGAKFGCLKRFRESWVLVRVTKPHRKDIQSPFGYSSGTETAPARSAPGVGFAVERLMAACTLSPKNQRKRTNDAWCFAGSTCNRLNQNVFVVTILTFPRCPQHGTTRNDLISRCLIGV
jgi:hypothetical protein